jgi:hypothetical protein
LLTGAYLAKHSMAIHGLPALWWLWTRHGKTPALQFLAWSAGSALVITAVLQWATDGWFLTYILEIPSTHPLVAKRLFPGAEEELLSAFGLALGFAVVATYVLRILKGRAPTDPTSARGYWTAQIVTGLLLTVLMRGHHGGFLNVLIPGYWLLALGTGLGFGNALRRLPHPAFRLSIALAIAVSVWMGRWSITKFVPTDVDTEAGARIVERIRAVEGEVLVPHGPYYAVLAGKAPGLHQIALWDVVHAGASTKAVTKRALEEAIATQRFGAIVLASDKFAYGLKKHYRRVEPIRFNGNAGMPKSGWRARPRLVYVPKTDDDAP